MIDPAIVPSDITAEGGSSVMTEKLRKALIQPYRIPGFLKRQYDRNLNSVEGSQIIWPQSGKALLIDISKERPKNREVLVLTEATLISPGTERAIFNQMPNTKASYPGYPGYTGAGTVIDVGSEVSRFKVGDRVAAKIPHASIAIVKEDDLIPVPDEVSLAHACFYWVGVIALQGVRKAQVRLGERVAIMGQGLIGQLATQLIALTGAYPITAIAASTARLPLAIQGGAHSTISLLENPEDIGQVEADVTIEVSGYPEAIHTAIDCTRPGGRIIVLGSNRGTTRDLDFGKLRDKGVTLVGASAAALPTVESHAGWWTAKKEAEVFLQLISEQRLDINLLISDEIYPSEAERFYRRLAYGEKSILGGLIRWDKLPDAMRFNGLLQEALTRGYAGPYVRGQLAQMVGRSTSSDKVLRSSSKKYGEIKMLENNSSPLRIGLIGCGEIAVSNAKAVDGAPNATITAVADIEEAVARDLAQKYDVPYDTSAQRLLARDEVDAVLISAPHFLHSDLTVQAAQAGKHVLVEKPMATSVAEAFEMLNAARNNNVHLATLFPQRYNPDVQRAKALIEQEALGNILGVSFVFYTDKPISYYASGFSGRIATDWRMSKEKSGGGILVFNIVHYLDMIRYITGLEVTKAYADYGALETPFETEDSISVTLRYDNQAIGNIVASSVVRGTPLRQLRIWGSDGQVTLASQSNYFYTLRQIEDYRPGEWHSFGELPKVSNRKEFVTRFARAILKGEAPEMTAESGWAVQAVSDAIYTSGELGRAVAPETLDSQERVLEAQKTV